MNQFFADKAMAAVDRLVQQDKDVLPLVWVHDYHLTLAAALIRQVKAIDKNYRNCLQVERAVGKWAAV